MNKNKNKADETIVKLYRQKGDTECYGLNQVPYSSLRRAAASAMMKIEEDEISMMMHCLPEYGKARQKAAGGENVNLTTANFMSGFQSGLTPENH